MEGPSGRREGVGQACARRADAGRGWLAVRRASAKVVAKYGDESQYFDLKVGGGVEAAGAGQRLAGRR